MPIPEPTERGTAPFYSAPLLRSVPGAKLRLSPAVLGLARKSPPCLALKDGVTKGKETQTMIGMVVLVVLVVMLVTRP